MDTRRLSLILMLGGAAITAIALIWFMAAYAEVMGMAGDFLGSDSAARLFACLYSSSPVCQGAGMFSDGPSYSPVVFWIGLIGLLAGLVIRFSTGQRVASGSPASASDGQTPASDEILGCIPPGQYTRYSYLLVLGGAVAGLLIAPLAVFGLAGFVLALLGLTTFRPRMNALDIHHLGLICLVFVAAALLLLISRGTFLFLLVALAQIACFYVAFNSYRGGRTVDTRNLKHEFQMAFRPKASSLSDHEQR